MMYHPSPEVQARTEAAIKSTLDREEAARQARLQAIDRMTEEAKQAHLAELRQLYKDFKDCGRRSDREDGMARVLARASEFK